MVRQAFDVLFVITLVAPVVAVLAGVVLLAWPRHIHSEVVKHAHSHA